MSRRSFLLVLVILWGLIPRQAHGAPAADLWPRWQAFDPDAHGTVDHAPWGRFLERYLRPGADGITRVAYAQVTAPDKERLSRYVAGMASIPVSRLHRDEQQAFWINLYNALTIKVVLDHFPVESILDIDISPGFFTNGPWGKKLLEIEGEALSLDDMEHRILRPIWRDPRLHYALNCASVGCPNLQATPYSAIHMEAMLDDAARQFINHPRGARVDQGRLTVSSIYVWFKSDFGGADEGVLAHLRRYAAPGLKANLSSIKAIADDDYDWSLNGADRP
ncbi:DUF547 domain-containing protein [Magnetospira sp. QH-2]|uniref:DUF547 domain-containing protein n=1 Tax=Magnetospira sp. (strain QH-2) TaxID=1288970 RepID=UPI0005FA063B|nr:DUF547 domain-containing protein [Magnetospira sp. QH-2]